MELTSVEPGAGPTEGGVLVQVTGENFPLGADAFVLVNTSYATATVLSETLVEFMMPPCRDLGMVDVTVVTGDEARVLRSSFEVTGEPPAIASATPPVGEAGTRVTIVLTGFPTCLFTTVTFDGMPAASIDVLDVNTIVAAIPPGLPVGQDVRVVVTEDDVVVETVVHHQAPLAVGDLTVNEFLADPRTLDANGDGTISTVGDEFVEIVNQRPTPVNLSGVQVRDASRARHVFPTGTTLPGGGAIVVFGFGNPQGFAGPDEDGQAQLASTGQLNLGNNGDTIFLRASDGTTEVFRARYLRADVARDRSRNALADGGPAVTPAASADYEFHDLVPGASGPISPGRRVDGSSFQ